MSCPTREHPTSPERAPETARYILSGLDLLLGLRLSSADMQIMQSHATIAIDLLLADLGVHHCSPSPDGPDLRDSVESLQQEGATP